jgi:hypothetical protein
MARVAAPANIADVIARKAVQNAREDLRGRGWKSSGALQPYSADGAVGISSTLNYLLKQNSGFGPFVMWWVKNRTVPLACKFGDGPHFRSGNTVGTAGYVNIPHKGRVFKPIRWRHPGLQPKRFMEKAISQAIKDSRADIRKSVMSGLKGEL